MVKTGIKEARKHFSEYLNMVQEGEEIIITKRDEPIAKLVSIQKKRRKSLQSHKELRDTIKPAGKPLSEIIFELREEYFGSSPKIYGSFWLMYIIFLFKNMLLESYQYHTYLNFEF